MWGGWERSPTNQLFFTPLASTAHQRGLTQRRPLNSRGATTTAAAPASKPSASPSSQTSTTSHTRAHTKSIMEAEKKWGEGAGGRATRKPVSKAHTRTSEAERGEQDNEDQRRTLNNRHENRREKAKRSRKKEKKHETQSHQREQHQIVSPEPDRPHNPCRVNGIRCLSCPLQIARATAVTWCQRKGRQRAV